MRWFIGTLIAVNLAILAWGWLGDDEQPGGELAAPGVGTIRLLGEPPEKAEPVAVPIPAPPRETGELAAREPLAPADVAGASVAAVPQAEPLGEDADASPAPAAEPAEPEAVAQALPKAQVDPETTEAKPLVDTPEPRFVPEPGVIAPTPKRVCVTVGPFADAAAAKATRSYLAGLGKVSSRQAMGETVIGHWVLVPPQPSRAAAEAVAAKLKAKGIKDYWIIGKGELKNAISLGVFSQKDNADSLVQRTRAKDIPVELRDKTKPVQQVWLDYDGAQPVTQAAVAKHAPADVRIESRSCPAAGQGG